MCCSLLIGVSTGGCPVVSWQESREGFVTKLSESRKLLDAPFSLPNKCVYPVIASSWHLLLPLVF